MNFFHMISVGNSQDGEFDIIIGHLQDIIIGKITCTTHIQTYAHTHTHTTNVNPTIIYLHIPKVSRVYLVSSDVRPLC